MKRFLFALTILAAVLAACSAGTPTPTATLPPPAIVTSAAPTLAPTAAASPTPAPGKVLLVAPNAAAASSIQDRLSDLAAADHLTLASLTALTAADLTPDVRIVVLLAAPANLGDLLTAAPRVQFLAIGVAGLQASSNLSLITQQPENAAFVAGFIATVISEDWRSAGLVPDSPASIEDAFLNGGRYFCGRCIPIHGPIVAFPLSAALPATSSLADWTNAVTQLQTKILETVYVDPTISSTELLRLLMGQNLALVGGGQTPPESFRSQWAASVTSDVLAPLAKLWPDLLAGKGSQTVSAAIQVTDINPSLLTPGKQLLMQDVITGLQDGTIGPLTVQ